MNFSVTNMALLCLLALAAVSHTQTVQVGNRFPLGVGIGNGGNCSEPGDEGYLRYESNAVEVCNGSAWLPVGTAEVADLNERLSALESQVGGNGEFPTDLAASNTLLTQQNARTMCNLHGFYNMQTLQCDCDCDGTLGCFTSASFCTVCDVEGGWTGTYCKDDIGAPVITVLGDSVLTIEGASVYVDAGATATDNKDGSISVNTLTTIDTLTPGSQTVEYSATDAAGNSATATRTVVVVDTTDPTVELVGDNPVTVEAGAEYVDAGATASDAVDTSLDTVTSSTVDIYNVGTYSFTHTFTDDSGNSAGVTRTVVVEDTTPPTLTLESDFDSTLEVLSYRTYMDAGARAYDNSIPPPGYTYVGVEINSTEVDLTQPGTYSVHYSFSDPSNNTVSATRSVQVVIGDTNMFNLRNLHAPGNDWTIVYQNQFSGNEGGPPPSQLNNQAGSTGLQRWKANIRRDALTYYEFFNADEMFIYTIDESGFYGTGPNDPVWLHFTSVSETNFDGLWDKSTGSSTSLPSAMSVTSSTGATGSLRNSGHHHGNGVVQLDTDGSSNSNIGFEFNLLTGSRDTNHYWYIAPALNGVYAANAGLSGTRWGGVGIRRSDGVDLFQSKFDAIEGGNWLPVYGNLFQGNEKGPLPSTLSSWSGDEGYISDFSRSAFDVFERNDCNQMLIWMVSDADPHGWSNQEVVWILFENLSFDAFKDLWQRTQSSSPGSKPYFHNLSVKTSSGFTSSTVTISSHHHSNGVIQVNHNSAGSNDQVGFEYNVYDGINSHDTNHYFYIWPSFDGVYAVSSGVTGARWGGVSIRRA